MSTNAAHLRRAYIKAAAVALFALLCLAACVYSAAVALWNQEGWKAAFFGLLTFTAGTSWADTATSKAAKAAQRWEAAS